MENGRSRQMWRMKLLASGEEDPQKSRENKMKIVGPGQMEGLVFERENRLWRRKLVEADNGLFARD